MSTLVGSETQIPNESILVRMLQMGVVIEEYAEEKSAFILSASTDDEYVHDLLFESVVESEEHRDRLLRLIDEISDSEVDKDEVEKLVKEAVESSVGTPDSRREMVSEQLKSERLAYNFYDNLIEACRNSGEKNGSRISEEKLDKVVSTLEEIKRDEAEDAEKLETVLNEGKV